jgi:S-layer protein
MSNATYSEVKTLDPASLTDALYARDFANATDTAVATTLVTNLGLSSVAGLVNWVAAQLTSAGSHKGAKIVDLLNGFAQMSSDATYGAAATAFNTKVDAALVLSQTTGNAGGTFAAAGTVIANSSFTLTTGVDAFVGGAGNDTFAATASTLTILDNINGGAGTDSLTITDASNAAFTLPTSTVTIAGIETIALAHSADAAGDVVVADVSANADVRTLVVTNAGTAVGTNGVGGNDGATITTKGVTSVTINGGSAKAILDATISDSGSDGSATAATGDTLTTVTLEGIGDAADEAVAIASDALTTLNVKNVTALITNTDAYTSDARDLTINYNGGTNAGVTDAGAKGTATVNIVAATTDAGTTTLAAASTLNLNVNAALTAGTFTTAAAKTVNVALAAKVTAATLGDTTVTALNISGTADATLTQTAAAAGVITNTGSGKLTLNTAIAAGQTYVGGSGVDTVTFAASGTKASTLGAGDDVATFSAAASTGGSVDGGDGTDTMSLAAADAVTVSANATFKGKVSGFERISLGAYGASAGAANANDSTISLANLDDINYVTSAGAGSAANAQTYTISGFQNAGTFAQTAILSDADVTVALTGAFTGASNTFNLSASHSGTTALVNVGTLTLASVETVNISLDNTSTSTVATTVYDLNLDATSATTVTVTGDTGITFANSSLTSLRTLDASGVTGTAAAGAVTATAAAGLDTTMLIH